MIALEPWERARFEEELRYYSRFLRLDGGYLPLEHNLIIARKPRRVSLTFLLVQTPCGLAYESIERVVFMPSGAEKGLGKLAADLPNPAIPWTVLV